jgi:hypothetical protein
MPDNLLKNPVESVPQAFLDLISRLIPGYLAIVLFRYILSDETSIVKIIESVNSFHWVAVAGASWTVGLLLDIGLDWIPCPWINPVGINQTITLCRKVDDCETENNNCSKTATIIKMLAEKTLLRSLMVLMLLVPIVMVIKKTFTPQRGILYLFILILVVSAWIRISYHIHHRFMK